LPRCRTEGRHDPVEWVALAKAAGMKYITITRKHHDGFAMFDSKVSDDNSVSRTPYKKDVLKVATRFRRRREAPERRGRSDRYARRAGAQFLRSRILMFR
jgi:hypothetical protein